MTLDILSIIIIMIIYCAFIVSIGWWSSKFFKKSLEDYAMASRELKVWVLFGSVFGANISAVTLIGIPGTAYHVGWIAWPYFVSCWAWGTPFLFYLLGSRAYIIAQKFGYMTISEMIGGRWKSKRLSYVCSIFLIIYTIPYLMTGLMGGAVTLEEITRGFIPYWLGCLLVTIVVLYYLLAGGLRGAAWVNTFQTAVFLIGGVVVFLIVAYALGGPTRATLTIMEDYPYLLDRSRMSWQQFFSYGIILTFSVTMFPQVFMRLLAGKSPKNLRQMAAIYPLGGAIIFFVMAYCGMWGKAVFPELVGAQSDRIVPMLISALASPWVTGLLGAAIFAALMSTVDSQLMAASTIIVKDFLVQREKFSTGGTAVKVARITVLLLAVLAYFLALGQFAGIIKIIEFAFAGFALLWIPMFGALYWKRCTESAAFWSIIISQLFLIALTMKWLPESLSFGFLPGLPAMILGMILLVVVSYLTPAPSAEANEYIEIVKGEKESTVTVEAPGV